MWMLLPSHVCYLPSEDIDTANCCADRTKWPWFHIAGGQQRRAAPATSHYELISRSFTSMLVAYCSAQQVTINGRRPWVDPDSPGPPPRPMHKC